MASKKQQRRAAMRSLRDQLLARRILLGRALRDDLRGIGPDHSSSTSDILDAAIDTIADTIHTGLIHNESEEWTAISEALERMEHGVYGMCEDCRRDIPLSRLRAVPFAKQCIECRRRREHRTSAIVGLWQSSPSSLTSEVA